MAKCVAACASTHTQNARFKKPMSQWVNVIQFILGRGSSSYFFPLIFIILRNKQGLFCQKDYSIDIRSTVNPVTHFQYNFNIYLIYGERAKWILWSCLCFWEIFHFLEERKHRSKCETDVIYLWMFHYQSCQEILSFFSSADY